MVKPGQRQMIVQAWEKHVADRKRISTTASQVNNVYEAMWEKEMQDNMNEGFPGEFDLALIKSCSC